MIEQEDRSSNDIINSGISALNMLMAKLARPFSDTKSNAIIVDIDGTIAFMSLERGPFDWHKVGLDQPNLITIHMIKEMAEYLNAEILIVTGRDEVCRAETEEWLNKQGIKYTNLFMRPAGDKRKDTVIKQEIYREQIEPRYNVFMAFDDRPRVIKMYREIGVKVIDVGNGVDF